MYTAHYLPEDNLGRSRSGFSSEKEAIDYIATQLCNHCKEELAQGYAVYGDGEDIDRVPVEDALCTGCGSEWIVGLTSEIESAESLEELFQAGGWKKMEDINESLIQPPTQKEVECVHDWKFEGVKGENIVWKCSKCPMTFTDAGEGGDG